MQHRFSDPNDLPLPLSFHDAQICLLGPYTVSWAELLDFRAPEIPFFLSSSGLL